MVALLVIGGCTPGTGDPDAVRSGESEVSRAALLDQSANVLFLGTSLTAGYGLEDPERAFPGRLQELIDSAGLPFRVTNAGVSGDTSAGGLARLDWLLRSPVQVLVLELGANDGLRGQDPDALERNLTEIIGRVRDANPGVRVILAGMEAPPNLGEIYTSRFRAVFPRVAEAENALLIPFLLEGVAGDRELNQPDGIHPTPEGHEVVTRHVWRALEPMLREIAADAPQ